MTEEPNKEDIELDAIQEEAGVSAITHSGRKVFKPTSADLEKLMSQALNLNDAKIYHEPTCPICGASCREEVEQIIIADKDYKRAKELLKDKDNIDASINIIENHITNHALRGMKEIQKYEYIRKLKRYTGDTSSTLDKIGLCTTILLDRIIEVNSVTPKGQESVAQIEKLKSSETARLTSVFGQLLKLQAAIMGEMKSSGEVITIPTQSFIDIFNDAMVSAKTDGERNAILGVLEKLKNVNKG